MKKYLLILVVLTISVTAVLSQNYSPFMPVPKKVENKDGKLLIDKNFSISLEGNPSDFVYDRADDFLRSLAGRTGIFIQQERIRPGMTKAQDAKMLISVAESGSLELGFDESYKLTVTEENIKLQAQSSYGAIRGLATLIQGLDNNDEAYFFAGMEINDSPRFPWRGLLIDPARHWLPVEVIKRNIDGMAAVKMNVLHLHLTDDQGFRIESKVYPKLHEMGGEGDYYTQEQMRDIISYAAERGIRVVPEFDIPGHATSWLVGYPELASLDGEYAIEREWGIMDPVLDPTKESTYTFLDAFLTEMSALFIDEYIHIGGDENNGKHWNQAEHIQEFMKAKGIKDNHELQAMFNQRVHNILSANNKKMIGWDEIQHPNIPKNVLIQSWRGQKGLAAAAKAGYPVMLSNGYYIDLIQPASFHYLNDPLPKDLGLTKEEEKLVLGGEATMWGEQVTPETIDSRIWPRTAVIAERLWSPADVKDIESMYARMDIISLQLEEVGLTHEKNYEMFLRRLCRGNGVSELRILADISEPVKGYKRNALSEVNALSPYTRFIDATRPDAKTAREFNRAVGNLTKDRNENDLDYIKQQCELWYKNHQNLSLVLDSKPILHEIKPLAENLKTIAFIGMQAVEYIRNDKVAPEQWKVYSLEKCKEASKPYGETELMIVSGISELVNKTK